jgi:DNA-directed RNA polymerase specialized sigma24 family protein
MVQDAFLKVWLLRDGLSADDIYQFLKQQLKKAIFIYYNTTKNKFHASLFRLDDLDNPDFLLKVNAEPEDESIEAPACKLAEYHEQWAQVQRVIPSLPANQQQLIGLCLKCNFSYDRMANYLGGISDYVVASQVEAMLKNLKHILTGSEKLQRTDRKCTLTFSGALDELQKNVMKMRYELQYSFEEIASELCIAEAQVKLAYARAHQVCR